MGLGDGLTLDGVVVVTGVEGSWYEGDFEGANVDGCVVGDAVAESKVGKGEGGKVSKSLKVGALVR